MPFLPRTLDTAVQNHTKTCAAILRNQDKNLYLDGEGDFLWYQKKHESATWYKAVLKIPKAGQNPKFGLILSAKHSTSGIPWYLLCRRWSQNQLVQAMLTKLATKYSSHHTVTLLFLLERTPRFSLYHTMNTLNTDCNQTSSLGFTTQVNCLRVTLFDFSNKK